MRALNKHTAPVAGIAPGDVGVVDAETSGVRVFIEAGWLVDADTIAAIEPEPTLEEMRAKLDEARAEIERARSAFEKLGRENEDLRANALNLRGDLDLALMRAAELEAQNKHLAAVAETNSSELKKAHDANGKLAARIAELEAQLAAKAESAPTAEPTSSPEAPAKKGKG